MWEAYQGVAPKTRLKRREKLCNTLAAGFGYGHLCGHIGFVRWDSL